MTPQPEGLLQKPLPPPSELPQSQHPCPSPQTPKPVSHRLSVKHSQMNSARAGQQMLQPNANNCNIFSWKTDAVVLDLFVIAYHDHSCIPIYGA